ncbi:probable LRR receptor-like serine/threonine-protein kinase RFK1 isoform X2 [Beta vulgaris subsp. vulgaris]|uniref:probable LRR receptor-like serine/threonine-protein kinase RFK1 isoform X2 n=1 Tax=Beta vulgaris subsp. vulgaris TaxID=3555 RepID=UPI002036BDF5|nr:probable LRR receptor-like serine/threonine-protein kinase RFK1 isoform X2 [Beta vulgaris subsp. vulgaris]
MTLKMLVLSSNHLSGTLPQTLVHLKNLTGFRINHSNFDGVIPDYTKDWEHLNILEMHVSGLQGPIASGISSLNGLTEFVPRNCNIAGEFPAYLWKMKYIKMFTIKTLVQPILRRKWMNLGSCITYVGDQQEAQMMNEF